MKRLAQYLIMPVQEIIKSAPSYEDADIRKKSEI